MKRLLPILCIVLGTLVSSTPALAAQPTEVWSRLADCESGVWDRRAPHGVQPGTARWNHVKVLADGTRYESGLHFDSRTWDNYRLPRMAAEANRAHIFDIVWVAERVLEAEGWRAWWICSGKLGYRRG